MALGGISGCTEEKVICRRSDATGEVKKSDILCRDKGEFDISLARQSDDQSAKLRALDHWRRGRTVVGGNNFHATPPAARKRQENFIFDNQRDAVRIAQPDKCVVNLLSGVEQLIGAELPIPPVQ